MWGGIVYGGREELEGWRASGLLPRGVAFLGRSVLGLWVLGLMEFELWVYRWTPAFGGVRCPLNLQPY